jgi:hypothetical protein
MPGNMKTRNRTTSCAIGRNTNCQASAAPMKPHNCSGYASGAVISRPIFWSCAYCGASTTMP